MVAVSDGFREGGKHLYLFEYEIGIGRCRHCCGVWPSVARAHETETVEPAVEHRTGAHADVLPELRFDEDDDRLEID